MADLQKIVGGQSTIGLVSEVGAGAIPSSEVMYGQVGPATLYVTEFGTRAWVRERFITPGDNNTMWIQVTPELLDRGIRTPAICHGHGAASDADQIFDGIDSPHNTGMTKMLDSWLGLGWAVHSLRLGSNPLDPGGLDETCKWGNQASRTGGAGILNQILGEFAIPVAGFGISSYSAGGCMMTNVGIYSHNVGIPIAGFALNDPALWLRNMRRAADWHEEPSPYGSNSNISQNVARAYACPPGEPPNLTDSNYWPGSANWIAAVDTADGGHDPVQLAMDNPAEIPNVPFLLMASTGDTTVQTESNGLKFYNALTSAGRSNLTYHAWPSSTNHGASGHFDPTIVNPFFEGVF